MRSACALTLVLSFLHVLPALAGSHNYYVPDLQHRRLAKHVRSMPRTLMKRISNGYGLRDSSATLYKNSIAIGFLPDFSTKGSVNAINAPLDEPISLIGDYVQIYANENQANPPLVQVDYHLANVTAANPSQQPVYVIALQPQDGFAAVTPAVINAIVAKMQSLNNNGITVWLRYAFEMNLAAGSSPYSGQPAAFISSFRAVSNAIRAGTTDTYMLWSPNVDTSANPNYQTYFPGAQFIDLYGLSLYSFAASDRTANNFPPSTAFADTFQSFYNLYGANNIVISESSDPYNYVQGQYPQSPQPGTAQGSEASLKTQWFQQLTSTATKQQFPNIIAVNWFEFLKDESGVTADFRALTGMPSVRNSVAAYLNAA